MKELAGSSCDFMLSMELNSTPKIKINNIKIEIDNSKGVNSDDVLKRKLEIDEEQSKVKRKSRTRNKLLIV